MTSETDLRTGIVLLISSILMFTVMDALANALTQRHSPLEVVWARYLGQVVWTVVLLAPRLPKLVRTNYPGLQLLRSALLFGATFCFYTALAGLELAQATAIFEVAPLLITLLAVVFLGETVGVRRIIALGLGLIGALIIIRPGLDVFTPYALMPLAAAMCYASYSIATRFLGGQESPWTSFVWSAALGALAATVMLAWPGGASFPVAQGADVWMFLLIGLVGGIGQLLLIMALFRAPASILAPFGYVGLPAAAVWGLVFFDEWPDPATWFGASLIIGSGIYVWYRETVVKPA